MQAIQAAGYRSEQNILGHWIWAALALLALAFLSFRQIDWYAPTVDEFYSMYNSGWIINSPYTPLEVLQSLQRNSPNHTPGYFLLLNLWGNLVGYDVLLGRALTILAAFLALAMIYRLARDFVAPVAGLFALGIVLGSAFYNYFIPHVRMYPQLLFLSTLALWLYLRITYQQTNARRREYLALFAASYALANIHAFSALLFATLGIYHALVAPKKRRWAAVSIAILAALLLFSPWIVVLVTGGIDRTFEFWDRGTTTVGEILNAWFAVTFNGSLILPAVSLVGVILGLRRSKMTFKPHLLLFPIFVIVLGITAWLTGALGLHSMRLTLPGWPPTLLFLVAGLYQLYRWKKWLGLCVIGWLLAGLGFQQTTVWRPYLEGRIAHMASPPWHAISRKLQEYPSPAPTLSFRVEFTGLSWPGYIDYPQRVYYFERHGIPLHYFDASETLRRHIAFNAITEPAYRLLYREDEVLESEAADIVNLFAAASYEQCSDAALLQDIRAREYRWEALSCAAPALVSTFGNDLAEYEFYGIAVNAAANRLTFADRWSARDAFIHENYRMSFQVLGANWDNVAQLDLEMAHEGELRHFAIDISGLPAGGYRLVAILYDIHTGEKVSWIDNAGAVPSIQPLSDFVIPEQ